MDYGPRSNEQLPVVGGWRFEHSGWRVDDSELQSASVAVGNAACIMGMRAAVGQMVCMKDERGETQVTQCEKCPSRSTDAASDGGGGS